MCLGKIGNHVQHLEILPIKNFFNLCEFLNVLASFFEYFDDFPMPGLQSFKFTFGCEDRGPTGPDVHGTGGSLLQKLRRLLGNLQNIKSLTLNNLLLASKDFIGLLDEFAIHNGESLRYLEVKNATIRRYPFTYAGSFVNLKKLSITPHQLSEDVLRSIANNTQMSELILVQDHITPVDDMEAVSSTVWWEIKDAAPQLRVCLEIRGRAPVELLIQENAPVHAVMFKNSFTKARDDISLTLSDEYSKYLRQYIHLGLPKIHGPRSFHSRGDSAFVLLLSGCPYLEILVINERISTATLLMIATKGQHLKVLCVRKNAVILKCDWPRSSEWDDAYYMWFKTTARSYEKTEAEVRRILGNPKWKMLTDWEFKRLDY
jgi:F-box protein 39